MRLRAIRRWVAGLGVAAGVLVSSVMTYAQGCAMCYNSAAAQKAAAIAALKHGILILLFPPLLVFVAIFVAAYRKRDCFRNEDFPEGKPGHGRRARLHPSAPPLQRAGVEAPEVEHPFTAR